MGCFEVFLFLFFEFVEMVFGMGWVGVGFGGRGGDIWLDVIFVVVD